LQPPPDHQLGRVLPDTGHDHGRGPIRFEAADAGVVRAKQSADFVRDRREDLDRIDSAGDQRGNPAQRSLLLQEAGERVTAHFTHSPTHSQRQ
jgi:hypothetical protein